MFRFFKTVRAAREAQRGLKEAFKQRGHNFMQMESSVHEALVKEAMATGVEATMGHFELVESVCFGRANDIIDHYRKRSEQFDVRTLSKRRMG